MVTKLRRGLETGEKVILGLVSIVVVVFIVWFVKWILEILPEGISNIGATATSTPINAPGFLMSLISVIFGVGGDSPTWEVLILHIAIFAILFFAFSDIINAFSSFSESTSWMIGLGLAIVAGVTKIITYIASAFALTSGIGAIGIILIVLGTIIAAVVLNLGIGGPFRRWRMKRQIEIEEHKSQKGASRVTSAIEGLKDVEKSFAEDEKSK